MATLFGFLLALAFGLLTGGADAAEELMPMRGPEHPGRTHVAVPSAAVEAMRGAGPATEKQPPEIRFTAQDNYVVWKNTLLRKPLMVAGGTLELEVAAGYASAQPYARPPVRDDGGFIVHLGKELIRYPE
jgi:hypothetical protein